MASVGSFRLIIKGYSNITSHNTIIPTLIQYSRFLIHTWFLCSSVECFVLFSHLIYSAFLTEEYEVTAMMLTPEIKNSSIFWRSNYLLCTVLWPHTLCKSSKGTAMINDTELSLLLSSCRSSTPQNSGGPMYRSLECVTSTVLETRLIYIILVQIVGSTFFNEWGFY